MEQETYESDAYKKYSELVKHYKKHPIKYVEDICDNYGIQLYWYQKIMLMMNLSIGKSKQAREMDKILRAFRIK